MKINSNSYIIGMIIIAFILRLLFEQMDIDWSYTWVYLSFFIIVSTYLNMYAQRHNSDEEFDFMMDFKGGAQGGALFSFGIGFLTYIFYKWINPHFLEIFVSNRRDEILQEASKLQPEKVEDILKNFDGFAELVYVPGNWSMLTLTGLVLLSLFYAIIFATITKYFPKFVNQ